MSTEDLAGIRALLEQGVSGPGDEEWFGEYRLLEIRGHGGMGIVHEADAPHLGRVALKRLLEPYLASESEERRFLYGAEAQARLKHQHIVKVLHVGKCRGRAYFTMELVTGGNLRARLETKKQRAAVTGSPRFDDEDLALLAKVADAVQHAHTHGVLHRDLKPENILLEGNEPLLADFGLAKQLDADWTLTEPGGIGGTVAYMSPEQAAGSEATRLSDVYSLGVILFEMITGRCPFDDSPAVERRQRIAGDEPVLAPRAIDSRISPEIERVCQRCLEKLPARRYLNAGSLRDDLQCLAARRAISIPPPRGWGRARHALRRNPGRVKRILRFALGVLGLVAVASYVFVTRARAERTALETNAFIAQAQAGAALFQFREFADRVEQTALLPEIRQLAQATAVVDDPPEALKALAVGFDAAFVVTKGGHITAQWPVPPRDIWARWYGFRDYFVGAKALGEQGKAGAYVARAFRSERDGQIKSGVSAPLFEGGKWIGVLVAIVSANPVFGRVRMRDESDGNRITALIGPRDIERGEPDSNRRSDRFVVIIHDKLTRGGEIAAPASEPLRKMFSEAKPPAQQFSLPALGPQTDSNYRDPVRGNEGQWHAAFAPVGGTGYVLVVQSRK